MTKLFITGATGYIGGDALYAIVNAHPEYEITALVRNSDKGAQVLKDYAKIRLVFGDLDSVELITEESTKADVVCHFANADHVASANAIVKGLAAREAERPGFYIHTSGTGILMFTDIKSSTYGETSEKTYDDLENVSEVTSLPDEASHRNVDKIVLAAGTNHSDRIKTAIVCPPTIYGPGRGPGNQISHQLPELCRATLQKGHGVKVGTGKTYWGNVHVHDLSDLYLKLVEEAAHGGSTADWPGKPAIWGAEGYYFCENGEHVWGDISELVATEAYKQGLIKERDVKSIGKDEANGLTAHGAALWGANSRARAKRARATLRWDPKGYSLKEDVKPSLQEQAKRLGVEPGHAKVAAGEAS
ncbi:hypothetical protein LTR78_003933 [Recurvomyces mirabilis]|uniref:NAD-dependent epimerase/dehydratase domain-containing protein n=1 Tax=Recurvomyces mirabilis TaxID=574656 RepID=A0AAE1C2Z5_9PEZI|nr:hypothetical protein LTR78_003933 [Recurvomyces mirabilis]KAK5153929.1 hypothetical protein LTS14_007149 [Recurvomyces mirabilis]